MRGLGTSYNLKGLSLWPEGVRRYTIYDDNTPYHTFKNPAVTPIGTHFNTMTIMTSAASF